MSDPVSNAEIEDVLSSIRRLVSEEPSPLHRRKKVAEAAQDRFVLTPALRVEDDTEASQRSDPPNEAPPPEQPEAAAEPDHIETTSEATSDAVAEAVPQAEAPREDRYAAHRQTLEQRISELEAALQNSTDEWEPDGSEVPSTDPISMPSFHSQADSTLGEDEAEQSGAAEPDRDETEADRAEAVTDKDTPLQLGDVGEMVADQAEMADFRIGSAGDMPGDDEPRAEDSAFLMPEAEEATADEAPLDEDNAQRDASGEDLEAQPQFGVPPEPERQADPEDAEPELESTEALAQQALPEPDQPADAETESVAAGPADPGDDNPSDADDDGFDMFATDTVLDESALRELVGQLVREELQGVLGERITRNVRRLVRREIQRALAMNDLE